MGPFFSVERRPSVHIPCVNSCTLTAKAAIYERFYEFWEGGRGDAEGGGRVGGGRGAMKGCRCQADSLIQVFAQFSGDPKDPI